MLRIGCEWVTRWPAKTEFPISPIWTIGVAARASSGGGSGFLAGGAGTGTERVLLVVDSTVVVVVDGSEAVTRVGASKARLSVWGPERRMATDDPPTRMMAVSVARTSARSARDSGSVSPT